MYQSKYQRRIRAKRVKLTRTTYAPRVPRRSPYPYARVQRALPTTARSISNRHELKSNEQLLAFQTVRDGVSGAPDPTNPVPSYNCLQSAHIHRILRGTASYQRVGRQIYATKLHGHYEISWENDATSPQPCRVLVVLDRFPRGANSTNISDVLDLQGGPDNTSDLPPTYAFRYLSNTSRFEFLHDKVIRPPTSTTLTNAADTIKTNYFPPQVVEFNVSINSTFKYKEESANGDLSDIDQGALIMFLLTEDDNVADAPQILGNTRLRYTDL